LVLLPLKTTSSLNVEIPTTFKLFVLTLSVPIPDPPEASAPSHLLVVELYFRYLLLTLAVD